MFILLLTIVSRFKLFLFYSAASVTADDATEDDTPTVDEDIGKSREGSRTDDEAVQRYSMIAGNCVYKVVLNLVFEN